MNPLQQTKKLMEKMEEFQKFLEEKEVSGEAAAGAVKVLMNCKYDILSIKIERSLVVPDDVEILEDLLVAAIRNARSRADEIINDKQAELYSGMPKVPGLSF
jgi:DNA-binding YbaB/EbfC family protein